MDPFVSICIPAYKRVSYLKRLLDSLAIQTFRNFEVIITDDSDDLSVKELTHLYEDKFHLYYHKNIRTLGTPANWNSGISLARGEWIKLMHDDDWFTDKESLALFCSYSNKGAKFIFSAYSNFFDGEVEKIEHKYFPASWKDKILKEPNILLAKNVIGPPSVTMLHKSVRLVYDEKLKWRVDMEFYIRVLKQELKFTYIDKLLINVGISESQVTQSCIYEPSVELPEGYILLEKHGVNPLKNIWVYDAWWRLLRNMEIRNYETLQKYVPKKWPLVIQKMVKDLAAIPPFLLKNGVSSKTLMSISYLKNYSFIK